MKKDINIIYEDSHIIVCEKPHGIATQSKQIGAPDMVSILKNHISQTSKTANPYLAVIHRLDQPVRGILVFAKTPFAAKELNKQLTGTGFGKYYRALVNGKPVNISGTLEDYLIKNGRTNHSQVCTAQTPDAKLARLSYQVVTDSPRLFTDTPDETELDIALDTGRHHQIRVQLSHMGYPIVGDTKYNPKAGNTYKFVCLCAYKLQFTHPKTKKNMEFTLIEDVAK